MKRPAITSYVGYPTTSPGCPIDTESPTTHLTFVMSGVFLELVQNPGPQPLGDREHLGVREDVTT